MFLQAIEPENYLEGIYNAVAPNPVTNAELMRALRRTFIVRGVRRPRRAVKLGSRLMQTEASLVLDGCRCAPKRFQEAGFDYKFPDLRGALKDIYR